MDGSPSEVKTCRLSDAVGGLNGHSSDDSTDAPVQEYPPKTSCGTIRLSDAQTDLLKPNLLTQSFIHESEKETNEERRRVLEGDNAKIVKDGRDFLLKIGVGYPSGFLLHGLHSLVRHVQVALEVEGHEGKAEADGEYYEDQANTLEGRRRHSAAN